MTLTVHRGIATGDHVYDEIFYSENLSQNLSQSQSLSQNLSQQDENIPFNMASSSSKPRIRMEERQQHPPGPSSSVAPRGKPVHRVLHQGVEKGSKDSGLSSGSSTHQEQEGVPHRSRTRSQGSQGSQGSQWVEQRSNGRCRIEGNYEVQVRS